MKEVFLPQASSDLACNSGVQNGTGRCPGMGCGGLAQDFPLKGSLRIPTESLGCLLRRCLLKGDASVVKASQWRLAVIYNYLQRW